MDLRQKWLVALRLTQGANRLRKRYAVEASSRPRRFWVFETEAAVKLCRDRADVAPGQEVRRDLDFVGNASVTCAHNLCVISIDPLDRKNSRTARLEWIAANRCIRNENAVVNYVLPGADWTKIHSLGSAAITVRKGSRRNSGLIGI